MIDEVDHIEVLCVCVAGEGESLGMTDGKETVGIDEMNEEAKVVE